jgi:hypothetical protein
VIDESENVEHLADEVHQDHLSRLTVCRTVPLEKRGRRPFMRPKTVIISLAAAEKTEELAELSE